MPVFPQGEVACLSCNADGSLLLSGGADGKISLWLWGDDQFLHQVRKLTYCSHAGKATIPIVMTDMSS